MAASLTQKTSLLLVTMALSAPGEAQPRTGSGTSRLPDSTPMEGAHLSARDWHLMIHGFLNLVFQTESNPRGREETFSTNMVLLDAGRELWGGELGLRFMGSLEPTLGGDGYPLLLQTGESADGRNPLFDRQHPHDLLMEIAVQFRKGPVHLYFAPVGDPALGPSAFMHRLSSAVNPVAPLTHHWLDATHISYGVLTFGLDLVDSLRVEGSVFNGREPDQYRWNMERFRLDSYSGRVTWNPKRNWSLQASAGKLTQPGRLHPGLDVVRTTASVTHNRPLEGGNWQTTVAWGRNDTERLTAPPSSLPPGVHIHFTPGVSPHQNALLAETSVRIASAHAIFARFEWAEKDELFIAADRRHDDIYAVSKLSSGYAFDFLRVGHARWGVGAYANLYWVDEQLEFVYGKRPKGVGLFLRFEIS